MVLTIFSVHHLLNILDFDMVDLNLCGLHQLRHKLHLKIEAENPAGNIICQQASLEFQQPDNIQKTAVKNRISVTVKTVIDDLIVRIRLSEVLKESILDQFPKGWMAKNTKLNIAAFIFENQIDVFICSVQNNFGRSSFLFLAAEYQLICY